MIALVLAMLALSSTASYGEGLEDLRCDVYQFVDEETNLKGVININRRTKESSAPILLEIDGQRLDAACFLPETDQIHCGFWQLADTGELESISDAAFPYNSEAHHISLRIGRSRLMILCYQPALGQSLDIRKH